MTNDVSKATDFAQSGLGSLIDASRPIMTLRREYPARSSLHPHHHPRAQLLWATSGVLRVSVGANIWVVPPSHAVWIAGGVEHAVSCETIVQFQNLHLDPSVAALARHDPFEDCSVLSLPTLLRELILRLGDLDQGQSFDERMLRLCAVILDELAAIRPTPLFLPGGTDPRLLRVTAELTKTPATERSLKDLSRDAGASPRTIERLFRAETGLSFRQWRSRLRLFSALDWLDQGLSSTEIAHELGYKTASGFVAAFRDQFGVTPQSFLRRS